MPPPRIAAAFASGGGDDGTDEEEDFMSDKFLQQAEEASRKSKAPVSYSERRRKELADSSAKARQQSRAEREREAREEGLRKNLLQESKPAAAQDSNKALQMMLAMGYKAGESLGASKVTDDADAGKASEEKPAKRAAEPLELDDRWQGKARHGLGSGAVSKAIKAAAAAAEEKQEQAISDLADFRSRMAAEEALRHTEALLSKARKICENLDTSRLKLEYSPLWIDPAWLQEDWERLGESERQVLSSAFGAELDSVRGVQADDGGSDQLARREAKLRKALDRAEERENEDLAALSLSSRETRRGAGATSALQPVSRSRSTISATSTSGASSADAGTTIAKTSSATAQARPRRSTTEMRFM